ncbi:MAG: DUF5915 domain-containing protein, partial [Fibromonadales bacterium]|nr:DUF5915 domain-containing protein [Fibromonadales bacterium]
LDLKITPELRQSCMARELVNRIQNRRKDMDLQITDKIEIALRCEADLQTAAEKYKTYILEETQAISLSNEGTGEWVDANIEGKDIQIAITLAHSPQQTDGKAHLPG